MPRPRWPQPRATGIGLRIEQEIRTFIGGEIIGRVGAAWGWRAHADRGREGATSGTDGFSTCVTLPGTRVRPTGPAGRGSGVLRCYGSG